MSKKPIDYNSVPKQVELFGRVVKTVDDSERLNLTRNFGEARYGVNQIAIAKDINTHAITPDEIKLTYLHEMFHFILNFTGFESMILKGEKIDLEQFIELLSSGVYQYEKSAKY